MDVRNAIGSLLFPNLKRAEAPSRSIETGAATDRDANGQTSKDGGEEKPPMSEEQFQKALEHLKGLPVVKDNGLIVETYEVDRKKFILIKEASGKVVRRIPEVELWSLQATKENEKGQLIRKTA